jgi:hypothetical protein
MGPKAVASVRSVVKRNKEYPLLDGLKLTSW